MKIRAAVALAPGKPLEVMTLALDGARDGEALAEIKASGGVLTLFAEARS